MSKRRHDKQAHRNRRRAPLVMVVLWGVLLVSLSSAIAWAYYTRAAREGSFRRLYGEGRQALEGGDFASLKRAQVLLRAALTKNQRQMGVWAALSLIEARLELLYGLPGGMWQKYRDGGTALLSEQGEGVLSARSEGWWQESLLLKQMTSTKGHREILALYFRARREWGYAPSTPGLTVALALMEGAMGRCERGVQLLKGIRDRHAVFVRGLLNLELGRSKEARDDFQVVLKGGPHELAWLGLHETAPLSPHERAQVILLKEHAAPQVRLWAKWLDLRDRLKGISLSRAVAQLPLPQIPYLLKRFAELHLQYGNREALLRLYASLGAVRTGGSDYMRRIDARILFMDGDPDGAWEILERIPRAGRGHFGVMFLWFAQRFDEAKREARGLPEEDPWRRLSMGDRSEKVVGPIVEIARHWKDCSEHRGAHYNIIERLSKDHEARFYVKYLGARLALESAHREGHGTSTADKLYRYVLKLIGEKEGESYLGKRLKALAWHCLGEDSRALALMEQICGTKGGVCDGPRALDSDREFLMELLLYPDGPEKDLEVALSKSLALLPKVARDAQSNLAWRARLALLQVTLLPGTVQSVVKGVLALIQEGTAHNRETQIALAPIYALAGQPAKSMELWRSAYGNEVDHSLHLASFLENIGHAKEALQIAENLLLRGDLTKRSRLKSLTVKAKALQLLNRDPVKSLGLLYAEEKSDLRAKALIEGHLFAMAKLGKRKEYCSAAITTLAALTQKDFTFTMRVLTGAARCRVDEGARRELRTLSARYTGDQKKKIDEKVEALIKNSGLGGPSQ